MNQTPGTKQEPMPSKAAASPNLAPAATQQTLHNTTSQQTALPQVHPQQAYFYPNSQQAMANNNVYPFSPAGQMPVYYVPMQPGVQQYPMYPYPMYYMQPPQQQGKFMFLSGVCTN